MWASVGSQFSYSRYALQTIADDNSIEKFGESIARFLDAVSPQNLASAQADPGGSTV
jgi:hypothetical protein